jgi:AraC-like DNA-binding protein
MQFDFDFFSSILLIFVTHLLVYAALLFKKYINQQQQSSMWLGFFLLLSTLYISPWMLGFAGWYGKQPYRDILFYTPLQHLFLIGPVIYFYVQSLLNTGFKFSKKNWLHFIPAIVYFLYCLLMLVYDKGIVKDYFFLKDGQDRDFDTWYQVAGFISMITYFLLSIKYYNAYRKLVYQLLSNANSLSFVWIKNFLLAFLTILIAWVVLALVGNFINLSYIKTWWYFLSFSISCYYIAIAGYSNAVEAKISFRTNLQNQNQTMFLLPNKQTLMLDYDEAEYIDTDLDENIETNTSLDNEFKDWVEKIDTIILKEKLFENAELNLPDLSKKLNTNVSLLSKIINKGFGLNFNDLINKYRVEAIIKLLQNGEHKKQTLLSIAYECGFNSKTTFNRAFKKQTNLSPQDYIKQQALV